MRIPVAGGSVKRGLWGPLGVILAVVLFGVWYRVAADYDYGALAGTYVFQGSRTKAVLVLRKDRTFHETMESGGTRREADGTWYRNGEGGVKFPLGFLPVPGAKSYREEFPDHLSGMPDDDAYYGRFEKILTLYPVLYLDGNPPEPTFHRKLFGLR